MDKQLFNKVANEILGQVKPLYLRKRIVSEILDIIEQLRKETAEKFAEKAREAFFGVNCIDIDEWHWYQDKIDEICKEITEGKL